MLFFILFDTNIHKYKKVTKLKNKNIFYNKMSLLLQILKEPIPTEPVILDFSYMNSKPYQNCKNNNIKINSVYLANSVVNNNNGQELRKTNHDNIDNSKYEYRFLHKQYINVDPTLSHINTQSENAYQMDTTYCNSYDYDMNDKENIYSSANVRMYNNINRLPITSNYNNIDNSNLFDTTNNTQQTNQSNPIQTYIYNDNDSRQNKDIYNKENNNELFFIDSYEIMDIKPSDEFDNFCFSNIDLYSKIFD